MHKVSPTRAAYAFLLEHVSADLQTVRHNMCFERTNHQGPAFSEPSSSESKV